MIQTSSEEMWCTRHMSLAHKTISGSTPAVVPVQTGKYSAHRQAGQEHHPTRNEARPASALELLERALSSERMTVSRGEAARCQPSVAEGADIALDTTSCPRDVSLKCALGTEQLSQNRIRGRLSHHLGGHRASKVPSGADLGTHAVPSGLAHGLRRPQGSSSSLAQLLRGPLIQAKATTAR